MAPSIKTEVLQSVAPLGSSFEDDFYMATFRGGKVQKVINMMGGPPRRVRRVLDFDSKREIEKEEALARKRKELGLASEFEVHTGKKDKTLAEMLLEMRQLKSAGVVATVQRKKLAPKKKKVKKAVPVEIVDPVEEMTSVDDVAEAVDEEIQVVSQQETIPVESAVVIASVQRKKLASKKKVKKAIPVKNVDLVGEVIFIDEVVETVDQGIRVVSLQETIAVEEVVHVEDVVHVEEEVHVEEVVHVEDAVHVEASPPRKKRKRRSSGLLHTCPKLLDTEEDSQGDDLTLAEYMKKSASTTGRASSDNAGIKVFQRRKVKFKAVRRRTSKVGDQQSASILVCDDLCECEVCGPLAPIAAEANGVPDKEQPSMNETSHPDSCTGEFESLTLPDDLHQLPVRHCSPPMAEADDFQELTEEQFRVEGGQQMPSNTTEVSDLSCPENSSAGRYDEYLSAPNGGPGLGSGMPEVLDAESRPQVSEEDGSPAQCSFNTESSSFFFATPHENAAPVVTPMELDLAVDRIESILDTLVTPDDLLPTHLTKSASKSFRKKKKRRRFSESLAEASLVENQRQDEELADPASLAALPEIVPSSVSEEVALCTSTERSGVFGQQNSEQIAGGISEQICEPLSREIGSAHEPTVHLLSEGKDTPAECAVDVEMVVSSSTLNAEECNVNDAVPVIDLEEVVRTPTKSTSCDGGSPERDETVGGTSTSKALFSNLKSDSFNKRNRKSFSPKSQKAFLAALKPERSTPSMKIKVMKSKLGERCSSVLFTHESDDDTSACPEEVVDDKPACPEEVVGDKSACPEEVVDDKSACPEEPVDDKSECPEEVVDDISDRLEEVVTDKPGCSKEIVDDKSDCFEGQELSPDDAFAQDLLQCDVEQTEFYASLESQPQSPSLQTSDEAFISSVLLSTPEPPSDCNTTHIIPEPFESRQGPDGMCTPDHSGIRLLPCTEGSLHIDVECHPETPLSDPKTPNDKIEPASQQPKSILKSAGSETCRGSCTCPRCVSTCDQSRTARKFIRSQMVLADVVASKLLDELRNLRTLVEETSPSREGTTSSHSQTKGALESASKTEDWAKKEMLKMSRDSKRVCRLIDVGPRRTIFADDAGHRLCHVKLLPAKKSLSRESLLPSKNL